MNITNDIMVLIRSDEDDVNEKTLRWIPLPELAMRKQAQLSYQVLYEGPSEEVLNEILQVFRDVFEYAVKTNWSYTKRLEFYHSFPFEELTTKEAVLAFRPILFGVLPSPRILTGLSRNVSSAQHRHV